ncbi:MAG: hypothetical protein ACR2M5_11105 [Nakamurella sp.]
MQFGQFASCTLRVPGATGFTDITDVEELGTTEDDDKDCRVVATGEEKVAEEATVLVLEGGSSVRFKDGEPPGADGTGRVNAGGDVLREVDCKDEPTAVDGSGAPTPDAAPGLGAPAAEEVVTDGEEALLAPAPEPSSGTVTRTVAPAGAATAAAATGEAARGAVVGTSAVQPATVNVMIATQIQTELRSLLAARARVLGPIHLS